MRIVAAICLMLMVFGVARAQDGTNVTVIRDVSYYESGDSDNVRQTLDLYLPDGVENFPVVMYVHGGAWVSGSKDDYANIGEALAQAGYGAVIINYRLSPEVTHPAHIEDVAHAFAWIVANIADYSGDPQRLVVSGHSAGGHMVSLLALDPQYLDAVDLTPLAISGVIAYSGVFWIDSWIADYATGAFPADEAGRQAASPINFVNEDAAPFLLLVSENDYPELIEEQNAMRDALSETGVQVQAGIMADREHFSLVERIGSEEDETTQIVLAWLDTLFENIITIDPDS